MSSEPGWEERSTRVAERRRRRRGAARRRRIAAGVAGAAVLLGLVAIAVSLLTGDDRTYNAPGFVQAVNEQGAGATLGAPLFAEDDDREVYGFSVAGGEEAGSLTVLPDEPSALEELARCRTAVILVCFRAANVVVALEGDDGEPGEDAVRLARALQALSTPAE